MDKFTAQMTGINKLLNTVFTKIFNYRDIAKGTDDRESLYLRRFYLKRKGTKRYFLHYIARSDDDRWLHDHPWDAEVIILGKGYTEEIGSGAMRFRKPWEKRFFHAEWYHRIHLTEGPVWTIFMPQQKRKEWGFLINGFWEPHYKYLNNEDDRR